MIYSLFLWNHNHYFRHTYEVAPVMVVLENYIFKKLSSIIGYQDGEGVFCPGIILLFLDSNYG